MNHLDKVVKIIKIYQKKQKLKKLQSITSLALLGVAIGGTALALYTKGCCEKTINLVVEKVDDIVDTENRDEIKETLKNVSEESLGDVGIAMENALDDLEEKKQNDN